MGVKLLNSKVYFLVLLTERGEQEQRIINVLVSVPEDLDEAEWKL